MSLFSSKDLPPVASFTAPPSRLIDLGLEDGRLRLVDTNGKTFEYSALSYCWGGDQNYMTKQARLTKYYETLEIPQEAKTIHDAVMVTRQLGLRYLWIDALCIVQDNQDDINKELARMPDIYKGSNVTIVAASARASSTGFLETRNPKVERMVRLPYRCPNGELGTAFLYRLTPHQKSPPIDGRAWTLQESLLAPRIIEFGIDTLKWRFYKSGESYGAAWYSPSKTSWPLNDINNAMHKWDSTVIEYSKRQLSKESDRLVALSAIAADFAHILNKNFGVEDATYAAGLWSRGFWDGDFGRQLLWHAPYDAIPQPRPQQYQAPSWSWASMKGPISFPLRDDLRLKISAHLLAVELRTPDLKYGQVTGGKIWVEGRLKSAIWMPDKMSLEDPTTAILKGKKLASVRLDAEWDPKSQGSTVWCLEGATSFTGPATHQGGSNSEETIGLVLCLCDDEDVYKKTFHRVGYFEISSSPYEEGYPFEARPVQTYAKLNWFRDCEEQKFYLI